MVKIVNPLGDVKTGKQGEAVYQRHYGQQTRRLLSPKRAIPSKTQLAHRQLYRDALAWRKQLSLPNRRYLEGYCLANWIVDSYKIPLPWSRFALKLYLQAIKFVLMIKAKAGEAGAQAKFEYYDENRSGYRQIYGIYWAGQTFTPQTTHVFNKLVLQVSGKGTEDIIISIQGVDGSNHPDGVDISQIIILGNTLPVPPAYEWREWTMPEVTLQSGTMYAIVVRCPTGNATTHYCMWQYDQAGATYPRGCWEHSGDNGTTWQTQADGDMMFEEWGYPPPVAGQIGLIHVRHPALLTVVHKRGGAVVTAYDTLSSLDDEYLTGQVGVDVETGDTIEATTLPGIEYSYQVS